MQVVVTILRATGYMGENKVPARDISTMREVCFYKLDTPPTARVKFNTCGPKCERPAGAAREGGRGGGEGVPAAPRRRAGRPGVFGPW